MIYPILSCPACFTCWYIGLLSWHSVCHHPPTFSPSYSSTLLPEPKTKARARMHHKGSEETQQHRHSRSTTTWDKTKFHTLVLSLTALPPPLLTMLTLRAHRSPIHRFNFVLWGEGGASRIKKTNQVHQAHATQQVLGSVSAVQDDG